MKKFLLPGFIGLCFALPALASQAPDTKEPNVSGQFYSADAKTLSSDIDRFLHAAPDFSYSGKIRLMLAPHAGYVYSGPVAAYGYKAARQNIYATVIVVGLSHFTDVDGFAIWPQGAFKTPLGSIEVDEDFCKRLMAKNGKVIHAPQAFEREHSLEVQLPFLQRTFNDFKLVPLLTGRPNLENIRSLVGSLNELTAGRNDVLVIVSTDMSHYHPDEVARNMDKKALSYIEHLDADGFWEKIFLKEIEMCNFSGVEFALLFAKLQGLDNVRVLRYANSGDVTGDKNNVVGYCSVVFLKPDQNEGGMNNSSTGAQAAPLTKAEQQRLIEIAKQTIFHYVEKGQVPVFAETNPRLLLNEGAFVTIHKNGKLRGCIGNIIGEGPLYQTVQNMAVASAAADPRFSPVSKDELKSIDIEISVLSKPRRVADPKEIRMGVHGVIVSRGMNRGVFLPQVATETGWSREEFLSQLCSQKAGLPPDAWKNPPTVLEIFTAQVFGENDAAK